jgi:beta-lactamase regulating signal transducer with metallopeptidase domain
MFALLLENTITAAALAVLVVVLCRWCRLGAPARHALWLVVVLKLLSPIGLWWSVPLPLPVPRLLSASTHVEPDLPGSHPDGPPAGDEAVHVPILAIERDERVGIVADAGGLDRVADWVVPIDTESAALRRPSSGLETSAAEPEGMSPDFYRGLEVLWLAGALITAGCYARRTWRFARYARSGKRASTSLQREVGELAARLGVRTPRVRVLADLPSPVVWCLRRPVLLWPRGLQDRLTAGGRRGVLVHELAHLRRRDHWVRWLELAAAVLYWWNPLFWYVRRQLRFHAELACDSWVTGILPEFRRDYAEALLEVCARFSRAAAPSPAVGVGGDGRDEFRRRLTMIMCEPAPCRLAAGVKLFLGLVLLAALPAWTLGQAQPRDERKPVEQKDLVVEDVLVAVEDVHPDADAKMKDLEAKIAALTRQLQALKAARAGAGQNKLAEPLHLKVQGQPQNYRLRIVTVGPDGKVIEMKEQPAQAAPSSPKPPTPAASASQPVRVEIRSTEVKSAGRQYKVIGADGKEISGAQVIFLEPGPAASRPIQGQIHVTPKTVYTAPAAHAQVQLAMPATSVVRTLVTGNVARVVSGSGDHVISLSRATYMLPRDKAQALAAFLKDNVKASVLEIKLDDRGLTVTTTPETQAAIGGIVRLMSQGHAGAVELHFRKLVTEGEKK